MGKKKGKSKGQNESNLEGEGEVVSGLLEEQVREGEVAAAPTQSAEGGGGKKGKKGRKKKALEEEWDDDLAEIAAESGLSMDTGGEKAGAPLATNGPTGGEGGVPPDRGTGGGGKKKKKKKENDDWEDEVAEELEKMQLNDTEQQDKQQQQQQQEAAEQQGEQQGEGSGGDKAVVKQSAKAGASGGGKGGKQSAEAGASGGGKGGKKKRKKKEQVDWEDDVEMLAREIEGTGGGVGGMVSGQTEKSSSQASGSPILEPHEDHATGGGEEAGGEKGAVKVEEEKGEEEGRTVKTKAEKKAAKKERDKKKKEGGKQKGKASSSTDVPEPQTPKEEGKSETVSIEGEKTEQVTEAEVSVLKLNEEPPGAEGGEVDGAEGGEVDGAEEEGEGDDKKKKKKKKKKAAPEEEKKGKSKKPAKSAILKMKEQIELMRAEQKRREEEELARQKAEEEAQQKEEELARLEQEKKEKKKQKEKERRERRRAVGKPVTKAEKERYAKAQMMLQAMKDQGLQIPALSTEREGGATGGKGKVRYGSRQRTKKMQAEEKVEGTEEGEERMGEGEGEGDEVKASWEDIEDGEDEDSKNVKEQWDDEFEDGEQDDPAAKPVKPDSPVQPGRGPSSAQAGEVAADRGRGEEEGESSEESSESESEEEEELTPYEKAKKRIDIRRKRHAEEMSVDLLRSPVVCVLGHVDTGKTKILDKIRHTNVQDGEAGGITQQIGATFVPEDAVRTQTKMIKEFAKSEIKLPGLLIIDTPGHESFSNLRSRGSSMCDLAVLVVDVMHGLEPQTLESMALLRKGKTPFIVALNKIDRLFDWRRMPTSSVRDTVKKQKLNTKDEFDERVRGVVTEFAEQGINVALFWDKVDFKEYIPLVPTSAHTGDGMGDLIALLVTYSQKVLAPKLMLSQEPEAVVLELKVIAGLGTTIDVILRNGILKEGDTLVLTGADGPFTTQVRALLMPQPMRELRVKNAYVNHKAIIASQGVKITAKDLEKTLAGTPVFVAKKSDEIDVLKDEASSIVSNMLSIIQLQERGVYVQASTLGSLEALLEFLKKSKIPYCGVNIGPVHKRDVMKASVMLEHDSQWAVILAFDVRVEREAQEMAENLGVRVFTADIIYHLFDNFLKHRKELRDQKRKEYEAIAIFPCKLRILPDCVFNTRDPIVVGVIVEAGLVKRGTILTVPSKSFVDVGVVSSLEVNHKQVDIARKGEEVCIKIASTGGDAPKLYGRHFDLTDLLISKVSRESIDAVKNYFREDLQKSDWQLFLELKKLFHII